MTKQELADLRAASMNASLTGIDLAVEVDPVNHPPHYTKGSIEVLDFILDQEFGYLAGQVIKYLCRYRYKGKPVEDLQKAEFYLKKLIRQLE
jgi:hypothetical protein